MTASRVAVVVPCHNDGKFIVEAITSVGEQERCELVVVDDGSDDPDTLSVLAGLKRDGVRVLRQENLGLAKARMAGIEATSARYVHPLDADDRLTPGALTRLADALDASGSDAAWGDYQTFDATDCYFPSAPQLDPWRITYLAEIPGTSMIRRDAILAVDGWDPDIAYEDWDLWMKLAERGSQGVHVPAVTLMYREHREARMLAKKMAGFDRHYEQLKRRRRALFAARRRNWSGSPSPWPIKLAFPLIGLLPGLSDARRRQLYGMARYLLEREMASDCYRSPAARIRERFARRLPVSGR